MVALLKMPAFASETEPSGADRRIFPRKEVHIRVQGRRMDHSIEARQQPFLSFALRDLSMGGLSAISQTAVDKGERVSVFFPPEGTRRGWDAFGKILRCDQSSMGFRVAVEFDPLPMAA